MDLSVARKPCPAGLRLGMSLACAFFLLPFRASAQTPVLTNAWSFILDGMCDSSPAVANDGTIYFGAWNGDFFAVRQDGTAKWKVHVGREIRSSPAVAADGTIYFGSRDRRFYAFGPDGAKKWEFKTGGWVDSSPAIALEGTIYFGSWDKNLYALKPDGSERWRVSTAGEIVCSPAIDTNGTIYFGSHDRKFYALTPHGTRKWEFGTGGPIISSPAIHSDGTVYFTSVDGNFYAVNPGGQLKWKISTGGITESSPVIGQDGTLYVGVNTALWAISPDGKKKWSAVYGTELIVAAPMALADGSVCFVSQLGMLINLTTSDRYNWIYDQNGWGAVSPTVGRDGRIYTMGNIVGTGILLRALQIETKLAESSWPKFRGDVMCTGNSADLKN